MVGIFVIGNKALAARAILLMNMPIAYCYSHFSLHILVAAEAQSA
jgi:hypothetical protein